MANIYVSLLRARKGDKSGNYKEGNKGKKQRNHSKKGD